MNNSHLNRLRDYLELTKIKIMLPVCLTGFTGYFAYDPHLSFRLVFTTFGVLLMAIAASILNQIQEVELDVKMNRTHLRPLPAGRIRLDQAIIFFFINLLTGTFIVYEAGNLNAVLIGLITILWYNGVYTYCKRITAFAVVPGAITGALPPFIGWVAAGGGLLDKPVIFIGFLIFIGQVPHFWLLILKYGEEYKKAGIPNLADIFSKLQINRLTFSWVVSSVFAALFLCYFEVIQNKLIIGILIAASVIIIWQFFALIKIKRETKNSRKYSVLLDSYFLLVLLMIIADRII